MKNTSKISFSVDAFEAISETSGNQLIGGFSSSMSMNLSLTLDEGWAVITIWAKTKLSPTIY